MDITLPPDLSATCIEASSPPAWESARLTDETPPARYDGYQMLYAGPLTEGSTCLDRLQTMRALGVGIVPFNTAGFTANRSRFSQSICSRFHFGPVVTALNRELIETARGQRDLTHIWIDKGVWVWPETVDELRELTGAKLIHYTPDPALLFHRSRHFVKSIPKYDALFTTKQFELKLLRQAGARRVVLTDQGFETTRFYPRAPQSIYAAEVGFIGHCEPHYARCLKAAAQANGDLKIWGPGWVRHRKFFSWAKPYVQGNGIWGDEYPDALCSFKICLGLLSKLIPETATTRTFEIPACGAFLLAERTEEHQSLFEEGKEAAFFSSQEELIDKIRYYLGHEEERARVARAGWQRCLASGYSNKDRLQRMLKWLPR